MKKFNITHESGYYRNPKHLPSVAGIYLVYKCNYNSSNDTVDIQDILYIGESENIHERHNGTEDQARVHEHYSDFAAQAGGEEHNSLITLLRTHQSPKNSSLYSKTA